MQTPLLTRLKISFFHVDVHFVSSSHASQHLFTWMHFRLFSRPDVLTISQHLFRFFDGGEWLLLHHDLFDKSFLFVASFFPTRARKISTF